MDRDLRVYRETMLLRSLVRLTRRMSDEVIDRMRTRGFPDYQPSYPRLLGNLDTGGTRIGALARRMGVTRQGASQLAAEIEAKGYLERLPDPTDRRGAIVRFTSRGREALELALVVMTEIEAEYADVLGLERYRSMKQSLAVLVEAVDEGGALGLD